MPSRSNIKTDKTSFRLQAPEVRDRVVRDIPEILRSPVAVQFSQLFGERWQDPAILAGTRGRRRTHIRAGCRNDLIGET